MKVAGRNKQKYSDEKLSLRREHTRATGMFLLISFDKSLILRNTPSSESFIR